MNKRKALIIRTFQEIDDCNDSVLEDMGRKLFSEDGKKRCKPNHTKLIAEPKHKLIVRSSNASPRAYIEED